MEWKKPVNELPPQGKKVLCFDKGDVYVAQRFRNYWFPIPFTASKFAKIHPPELWQEISFPEGNFGYMHVAVHGDIYDMDEFDEFYPEKMDAFIEPLIEDWKKHQK